MTRTYSQQCKVTLNQGAIEDAVKKGVTVDLSFKVPMRAGLDGSIHLGESVDFNLYSGVSSLGGGFQGTSVLTAGAGLTFRWDDIVPAVLPVERRLDREGCDAIEGRFRSCPNSRNWLSPEQRARPPELPANATQLTPVQALPTQPPAPPHPHSRQRLRLRDPLRRRPCPRRPPARRLAVRPKAPARRLPARRPSPHSRTEAATSATSWRR